MTILNQNQNVSEDYTFLITMDDIFYTYEELSNDFYLYEDGAWSVNGGSSGAETVYDSIMHYIEHSLVNSENQFSLIDMEQDYLDLRSGFYIGTSKIDQDQQGYPNDTSDIGHCFVLIKINHEGGVYLPVKTLPLYHIKIVDTDYVIKENEYVSALYAKTLITKGIEDLKIFEVLNAGSTNTLTYLTNNVSNPNNNIIYFVKKNNDSSDGLNISFDLYSYNNGWTKLDDLTLDVNDIPPKNHASSATTYGVGSSSNYGHVKVANNLTTSSFSSSGPVVLSAYQGKLLNDSVSSKQDSLISGTNIKTINNQSLLGSGDIQVTANIDMTNYYTKTEIDTMIGDIQDYIYS